MKKLTKALSIALVISLMTVPVFASTISLRINNQLVSPTVSPYESNGTTLVPLRLISEELGAKVDWNQKTKVITITQNDTTIVLTVGSKIAKVNGVEKQLLLAPQIKNNATMLPIRFVSENLNCTVNWDKTNLTVSVNSKDVAYEDSKGEKVTTFKNPKIINGAVYLTGEQLEEAFGVTVEKVSASTATITRKDFHAWLLGKDSVESKNMKLGDRGNRVNWSYLPYEGEDTVWVKDSSTVYFPVEYLAKYLNSTTTYDTTSKTLTITNNGVMYHEQYDSDVQSVDISGTVYLPDGSKANKGIVVYLAPNGTITKTQFLYTETDNDGNFVFKNVNLNSVKTMRISVNSQNTEKYKNETHNYAGNIMQVLTVGDTFVIEDYSEYSIRPDTIRNFDIYLYNKATE